MRIIGLSGYARSGKDTFADVLVERHGYTKLAFADALRNFLYAQNPIVGKDVPHEVKVRQGDGSPKRLMIDKDEPSVVNLDIRLRQVIDTYGWDGYKSTQFGNEIRSLIQRTGTEAGRQTLWEDIWVDATFKKLDSDGKYVISDARFPNEADGVKKRGGVLIRINRPGVGPALDSNGVAHPSETSLDDYDGFNYKIDNDGTVGDLEEEVDWLLFTAHGHGRLTY